MSAFDPMADIDPLSALPPQQTFVSAAKLISGALRRRTSSRCCERKIVVDTPGNTADDLITGAVGNR